MHKFKVGDKVIVDNINQNEQRYIDLIGKIYTIKSLTNSWGKLSYAVEESVTCWYESELEFADSLVEVKIGDILTSPTWNLLYVEFILNDIIYTTHDKQRDYSLSIWLRKTLINRGYSIKQKEEETIIVSGKKYKKSDVDSRLAELKEIK